MKNSWTVERVGVVLLLGAGASLYPVLSCALGLGDIQVESRLNQPLRARIEIMGMGDAENAPIRARVAGEAAVSDGAANAGLLHSLQLSVVAQANHRYFVVVTSKEALTEPLFDLPVEVAEQSLQVLRNYSVLLDPAPLDDGARSLPVVAAASPGPTSSADSTSTDRAPGIGVPAVSSTTAAAATKQTVYKVNRTDTVSRITRRLGARTPAERARLMRWIFDHNPDAFRGGMRHLRVGAKLTVPESIGQKAHAAVASMDVVKDAAPPTNSSHQEQLEDQLATLQQVLVKMQETISTQDAQISVLTRKIAATSQAPRVQAPPVVLPETAADEGAPETRSFWLKPTTYYGIVAIGGVAAILAWVVARWRKGRVAVAPRYPVMTQPTAPVPSMTERLAMAHGARGAPNPQGSRVTLGSAAARDFGTFDATAREAGSCAVELSGAGATEQLPGLDLDSTARIGATAERYRLDFMQPEGGSVAATDVMPFVMKPENQVKPVDGRAQATTMAHKLEMQPDGSVTNKEIVNVLERSLDAEPHRIDIQLKLLEMYHQEALGNLESFHTLLHQVEAEQRVLSPAQRVHVEMLQRTLDRGQAAPEPDATVEAAV